MGSSILHYRHPILLHTQMRDGCRCRPTICEWPTEFGPNAPGYQPCSGERRVSTGANQELRPLPVPRPVEGKEARATNKKRLVVPTYHSISVIQDFPPILGIFNPHLSNLRK